MEQPEEPQAKDLGLATSSSGAFVPPSVDYKVLLSGDSYEHFSPVPPCLQPSTKDDNQCTPRPVGPPCALGIDEAGRGPVLGPMVYGAFYLPIPLSQPLLSTTHHFDDSKVLTPDFRSKLMEKLCTPSTLGEIDLTSLHQNCGWAVSVLSARSISAGMLQPAATYNLNAQAMDATIALIDKIYALGVNVKEIFIDTIGQPSTYQKKLEKIFPAASIVVAKKADSLYPCVSAASVCAKVTRDVALEVLYEQSHGGKMTSEDMEISEKDEVSEKAQSNWGSGYPSDVRCTSWMKKNMDPIFGWGPECRFSWGTAKDMLDLKGAAASITWPVAEDDETSLLTDFFSAEHEQSADHDDELSTWYGNRVGPEVF